MQLKKILIVFLVVVAIFSCAGAIALAQGDEPATLDLSLKYSDNIVVGDKLVVKPGDSFDVSIVIDSNPGVILLSADLLYNTEILECTNHYLGNVFSKVEGEVDSFVSGIPAEGAIPSGELTFFAQQTNDNVNNTNTGVFITYTFKVKASFDGNIDDIVLSEDKVVAASAGWEDVETNVTVNGQLIHAHAFGNPELLPGDCVTAERKKFTCSRCGEEVVANLNTPAGHSYVFNEELPATCVTPGFAEHYRCSVCQKYFAAVRGEDDSVTYGEEVSENDLIIQNGGHTFDKFNDVVLPECETTGTEAHYVCTGCGQLGQKAEGSDEFFDVTADDLVISEKGHNYSDLHDEIPATCTSEGRIAYYDCADCGKTFDSKKNPVENLVIPAAPHDRTFVPRKEVACEENGYEGHYDCSTCDLYWNANMVEVAWSELVIVTDGHNYGEFYDEVPATCTNPGVVAHYNCANCGNNFDADKKELSNIVIDQLPHSKALTTYKAPACEVAGNDTYYYCAACDQYWDINDQLTTYDKLAIDALEHVLSDVVEYKAPTAAEFGFKAHSLCTRECGQYFDANGKKTTYAELRIDKLPPEMQEADDAWVKGDSDAVVEFKSDAHIDDFVGFWFNGQLLEEGKDYTVRAGSIIITLTEDFLATLKPGESYEVGIESTSGTATTTFAVTHDYGSLVEYKNATCTVNGNLAYYYCGASCCNTYFDANKEVVAANATALPEELIVEATGHVIAASFEKKNPTCTEMGYAFDVFKCAVCDGYYTVNTIAGGFNDWTAAQVEIPALGHNGVTKVEAVAPTCETAGNVEHFLCERCNKTVDAENNVIEAVLAALGHNGVTKVEAVAPTCETTGNIEHFLCERCNKTVDAENKVIEVVLPANGHNYGDLIAKIEPTCEDKGQIAHYKCSVCQKTFDSEKNEVTNLEIPANGHNYGEIIAKIEPTCEDKGQIAHYKCSVCQKTFDSEKNEVTDLEIPANGHNYGELIAEVPATCEGTGVIAYYKCSVCEKTFNAEKAEVTDLVIPANGHNYGDLIAKVEPTTEKDGTKEHYQCSACSKYFDANKAELDSIVILKLPVLVTTPEEPEWKKGSDEGLTFVSDAPFDLFDSVMLNGVALQSGAYEAKADANGQTVIVISPEYLDTLDKGDYSIEIKSDNGSCKYDFTLKGNGVVTVIIIVVAVVVIVGGAAGAIVILKKKNIIK